MAGKRRGPAARRAELRDADQPARRQVSLIERMRTPLGFGRSFGSLVPWRRWITLLRGFYGLKFERGDRAIWDEHANHPPRYGKVELPGFRGQFCAFEPRTLLASSSSLTRSRGFGGGAREFYGHRVASFELDR